MDKQNFAKVVDESLHNLRWRLLDAFPEVDTNSSPLVSGTNSLTLGPLAPTASAVGSRSPLRPDGSPAANSPRRASALAVSSANSLQSLQRKLEEEELEATTPKHINPELVPAFQAPLLAVS